MRRILPLLFLSVGFAMLLVSDTVEARHRRRCCRQDCYQTCGQLRTYRYCPAYKMMQMGNIWHYYTMEYDAGTCNNGTPVSYDSTNSSLPTCSCPGNCCFDFEFAISQEVSATINRTGVGHIPHGVPSSYKGDSNIRAEDPIENHSTIYEPAKTKKDTDGEFVVKIGAGGSAWWAKLGRFTYIDVDKGWAMQQLLGYEVNQPSGTHDVAVPGNAAIKVPGFDHLWTLTIPANVTGPHGGVQSGNYQVIRAND